MGSEIILTKNFVHFSSSIVRFRFMEQMHIFMKLALFVDRFQKRLVGFAVRFLSLIVIFLLHLLKGSL
jgi:hypothetical protein